MEQPLVENDDLLNCAICLHTFTDPKTAFANCAHVFCASCLHDYVAEGNNKCPICCNVGLKVSTAQEVFSLPQHTVIQSHIEQLYRPQEEPQQRIMCGCDRSEEAVRYCPVCDENLCSTCVQEHSSNRIQAKHHAQLVSDVKRDAHQSLASDTLAKCVVHNSRAATFCCLSCRVSMCNDCFGNHTGHKMELLCNFDSAACLQTVNKRIEQLSQQHTTVERNLSQARAELAAVDAQFEKCRSELEAHFGAIEAFVAQQRRDKLAALGKAYGARVKTLKATISSLEVVQLTCKSTTSQQLSATLGPRLMTVDGLVEHTLQVATQHVLPVNARFSFELGQTAQTTVKQLDVGRVVDSNINDNSAHVPLPSLLAPQVASQHPKVAVVGWKLDEGPKGVCFTPANTLIVALYLKNSLAEFSLDGSVVRPFASTGQVDGPWSVEVNHSGEVVVKDQTPRVLFIDLQTEQLVRSLSISDGVELSSCAIYNRTIMVINNYNNKIVVWDMANNKLVDAFGADWVGHRMHIDCSFGTAVDQVRKRLIFTSWDKHQVFVFDAQNGHHLHTLGSTTSGGAAHHQFHYPFGVTVHQQTGDILIADQVNSRLSVWTCDGSWKQNISLSKQPLCLALNEDATALAITTGTGVNVLAYPIEARQPIPLE
eukprot:TRINITY_DN1135_c0_g1_i9.p1 TRINITY_DN1135_c0_g1~~TRINITY_DN1135_c0_g1_i9.p1  ORF type:complete len:653 (+),score=129.08 TRINITY_DN1135_c0_g1_i9:23-1981(+)